MLAVCLNYHHSAQQPRMKILIIGGTGFLGRHLVTAAQTRHHRVTLFHRGRHSAEGLADVEEIYGNRSDPDGLGALKNRQWDAVIDTCGYLPHTVAAVAEALRGSVAQYVFVSSVAAYADFSAPTTSKRPHWPR